MTSIAHEHFHAVAEEPAYARANAPAVGRSAPAAISLTGLEKSFGANRVLRGINLHIPAGQFVAVIGKSGCGKSTLLRILMGLDEPTAGELHFEDAGGAQASPNARIVFQEPRLLPWLSVADNVVVGLGDGIDRRAALKAADAVLAEVQLGEKTGEWPARLSGGQRQRVALARALVSRPGVLALDEPLGALDALTRISMQELINRVWCELGFTAVLVTHDVSEAVHLADRVIVLDEGRIALDLPIPYPRPRRHGHLGLAELEGRLLAAILGTDGGH
ncbi:ATP-binding cassette domain-containing protein [Rhizobium leguminosarum]|uniref:ATP-binding cassette domain-containing protein n=1 Tax=Rhizobium leguminosarum TaxID=384 RepID=UPI00103002A3|nr:ATP-binding cassette domain-containing protein [Rhizobium leguminosarum]TAU84073.1 ATP-binding cassette domain-containing protein [Rhizobium leguminosarum]TAV89884.1 ATP-binding cassette domain-containing protein [Rhizobium leguminosarum]TAV94495.1 ATP-binding cassette domain-containing protein [Rhizobium leguminosarum]TAW35569.1 ATP-binding cassette domain-containing protein [Rhizobium leguminosarum]TAX30368.1 ATP-binding cassette domain-containing protein [Rhizobium leguminosarum]